MKKYNKQIDLTEGGKDLIKEMLKFSKRSNKEGRRIQKEISQLAASARKDLLAKIPSVRPLTKGKTYARRLTKSKTRSR